jgi:dihydrodipicolinate reductase
MAGEENKTTLAPAEAIALADKINRDAGGKIVAHPDIFVDITNPTPEARQLRTIQEERARAMRGTT